MRVAGSRLSFEGCGFRVEDVELSAEVSELREMASGGDHARSLAPVGRVRRVASTLSCATGIAN